MQKAVSDADINKVLLQAAAYRSSIYNAARTIVDEVDEYLYNTVCVGEQSGALSIGSILCRYCVAMASLINIAKDCQHSSLANDIRGMLNRGRRDHMRADNDDGVCMQITVPEAFTGCTKTVEIDSTLYTVAVPPFALSPIRVRCDDRVFLVSTAPHEHYTVLDGILFVSVALPDGDVVLEVELPDKTHHRVPSKHLRQLGSAEIDGYPMKVIVLPVPPEEVRARAEAGTLYHDVGVQSAIRGWDVSLYQCSSALKWLSAEEIPMSFNLQNTDHIECFELTEDTTPVLLKMPGQNVAVSLRHAFKYTNQVYIVPWERPIYISSLTPRFVWGEVAATLPLLCEGGRVQHDLLDTTVDIPRGTKPGDFVIQRIGETTYGLRVVEKPSAFFRSDDDVVTSVELPVGAYRGDVSVVTLTRTVVKVRGCSTSKVYRIVGGGVQLPQGFGDLVVTFVPKPEVLKDKRQVPHLRQTTFVRVADSQEYVTRNKRCSDGNLIPKVYHIPRNHDSSHRRSYYVLYAADGDSDSGTPRDLVFEVVPH